MADPPRDAERGPAHRPPLNTINQTPRQEDRHKHTDRRFLGPVTRVSPLAGLVPIPCQCWRCRWYRVCDRAIDLNGAVRLEGSDTIMVVADTVVAEVVANGGNIPDTWRFVRSDGRSVHIFVDEGTA